jgi:hypothetical protein
MTAALPFVEWAALYGLTGVDATYSCYPGGAGGHWEVYAYGPEPSRHRTWVGATLDEALGAAEAEMRGEGAARVTA